MRGAAGAKCATTGAAAYGPDWAPCACAAGDSVPGCRAQPADACAGVGEAGVGVAVCADSGVACSSAALE